MNAGSLFSGIGGFDLGLERVGFKIEWQVEIDDYARRVLHKHWPNVPCYGDIRSIDWATVAPVDVLCGGFPCQDLSYAGKRAGLREGTRSGLWFEYLRAIRILRPKYILVENVPGLLTNHALGRVLRDLAESGYDAEWDCLPASSVGSPHRRDRVWLLAYPNEGMRESIWVSNKVTMEKLGNRWKADQISPFTECLRADCRTDRYSLRRDHGFPEAVHRLEALGNAVVPQIVEALGRMILEAERVRNAT